MHLDFAQAIALGMMCNALVCLAVWLAAGHRDHQQAVAGDGVSPDHAFAVAGRRRSGLLSTK